jgi:ADP-ribose pyrophosphatase YjhB (NUDIX family)
MQRAFDQFAFCPRCGDRYTERCFDPAAVVFTCGACGYEFYQNSIPSATAVIPSAIDPDHVLLLTRRTALREGRLALPGGILRYGEDAALGAEREAREETTLEVFVDRLLCTTSVGYEYQGASISVLEIAFLMCPLAADLDGIETTEASRLEFRDVAEVLDTPQVLAFPEQASVLRRYVSIPHSVVARGL